MNRPASSSAATKTKPEQALDSADKVRRTVRRLEGELVGRVELEKALEESQLRFRNVVEFSIQGIFIHREWEPVFVNLSCARTFGYRNPGEMLAAGDLSLHIAPRYRDGLRRQARKSPKAGTSPVEHEFDGLTRDGKTLRLRGIVKMVQWSGQPAYQCTFIDVSESKRRLEALEQSQARLAALFDNMPLKIIIKDGEGRFQAVNRSMEEAVGLSAGELMGKTDYDLFPAETAERFQADDRKALAENHAVTSESDVPHPDGSVRTEFMIRFPIKADHSATAALGLIAVDISERKKMESALKDSEERFRNLIEGSIQGILIHRDLKPLFVNEAYAQIFGYDSAEEILAMESVEPLIAAHERERRQPNSEARMSGQAVPSRYEIDVVRKDGSIITLQNMVRVVNWDGQQAIQNTVFDITELKRAERALLQSEERPTDFSEAASDWFWETDSEHRFSVLSERFKSITGMGRSTFLGKRRFEIAPLQPDKNTWIKHLEDLRHRRPLRDFTYWTGDDDSGGRWFRINGVPVFDDAGRFSGYRGTGIDVTEEVERENRARTAEQRFVEALTHVSDGYALFDTSDRLVVCNDTYRRMQGRRVAAKIYPGMSFEELMRVNLDCNTVVDAIGREEAWLADRLASHQAPKVPFEIRRADDVWYLVREERTSEGGTILLESDITDIKRRENALQESEQRFKDFAETAADWFFETDAELRFSYVSERHTQLTGLKPEQIIGKTRREILSDSLLEDPEKLEQHFADLEAHRPYEIELKVGRPDGEIRIFRFAGKPVHSAEGTFLGYRGSGRDITEAKRLEEQMAYQATHDSLTGLVNRHELERRLARILDPDGGTSAEHALCYLDLDQFKVINDTCGHVAGDELLRQLGALLGRQVRKRDTVARLGGDEFGILMEHCPVEQATRIANTLRSAIEDYQFAWEQRTFRIGASIGVVPIGDVGGSVTDVLRAADGACYVAKEQGRNRVHIYRPDDVALTRRRGEMQWVARLHEALDLNRLTLFLQPIVPVKEAFNPPIDLEQCEHFEILLRIEEEDGSFSSPSSFLAAAERYNLATRLDRWVVNAALRWMTQAAKAGKEIELCSVNLSAQSLGDAGFLEYLVALLEIAEVKRESVCFEITETSAIANLNSATQFMRTMKDLGCRFALDDFGSGLSSFAYLKNLPVDYLKIDGTFVKDIASDPIDFAMVRSIADVGKVMGKDIIAEYVESEEVLAKVKAIGIDYAQGYYIGAPVPVDIKS